MGAHMCMRPLLVGQGGRASQMEARQRNERLAELMSEAGLSSKALARAVRAEGASACDHTQVGRWLAGARPRAESAGQLAAALGRRLGRRVTLADLGLSAVEPLNAALGTDYPAVPAEAATTLARLWRADLDEIRVLTTAPMDGAAWAQASWEWLVRTESEAIPERAVGLRVGRSDVSALRATTDAFSHLDNHYGGGHARRSLIEYLNTHAAPLLGGRYSGEVGRALFAATAEATLLAAWMSYDAGIHGLAQRYFIQALRLAQAASDVVLAGSILDAMSHQATFLGRSREAANLARAARHGSQGKATPTLTAHFYAMEARALAVGGDVAGANRALSESVRVFERRRPGEDPEWISYFDDAELGAEFSHCFRDIGRSADAAMYAQRSLDAAGASARSDFFVTMVLAAGMLGQGEVEEACRIASAALDLGEGIRSARCVQYLREFRRSLTQIGPQSAAALDLARRAADHPFWLASA